MSNGFIEKLHSDLVNAHEKLRQKVARSVLIELPIARWQYEKAKAEANDSVSLSQKMYHTGMMEVWRKIMVMSCPDHDYQDQFSWDNQYLGFICTHCGANSSEDEVHYTAMEFVKDCGTCKRSISISGFDTCTHESLNNAENDLQRNQMMNQMMSDCENCPFWEGKVL